jgi:AcrR family transcriptional regulator
MEDIIRALKSSPAAVYCYFRGKSDIAAAIAEQRHTRESALLNELLVTGNVAEGFDRLARAFLGCWKTRRRKSAEK